MDNVVKQIVSALNTQIQKGNAHGQRITALEESRNGKNLAEFYSNKQVIDQLVRSWDVFVKSKQVGNMPIQDYQIKEMTMFDFMAWLRKQSHTHATMI